MNAITIAGTSDIAYSKRIQEDSRILLYERWLTLLSELLKEDYIQLDISVENFDEAIKASAQPLLTADVIENEYISSILSIYHEIGPYIVITKQIALPHAPIEKGQRN